MIVVARIVVGVKRSVVRVARIVVRVARIVVGIGRYGVRVPGSRSIVRVSIAVQANLCQKLFFLQNMRRTCCVQKLF